MIPVPAVVGRNTRNAAGGENKGDSAKMGKILEEIFHRAGRSYGTGKWIFKSFTSNEEEAVEAEYALGRHLALEIKEQMEILRDPVLNDFVGNTASALTQRLTNKQRKFTFRILQSSELNAFALPGGFIFLTDALLRLIENREEEIAFILGHEIGHVVKGHALDRMVANTAIGLIARVGPGRGALGRITKKTLPKLLYSAYSKDQELEADGFGVGIMNAANYDPRGAIRFLVRLSEQRPPQCDSILNKYFSSHPKHEIRIRNIRKTIRELQK